jgi:MGT family glycosyltransferase
MARFLFAVFPVTGHVNPGLPIARELVRRGHDVRWYSTMRFKRAIEETGARFIRYRQAVPIDETRLDMFPERPKAGIRQLQWDIENLFVGLVPGQFADLEAELRREPADAVVGDNTSLVAAMLAERFEIPYIAFGISVLTSSSRDTAPFGLGLMPSSSPLGRLRNRALYWLNDNVIFAGAAEKNEEVRRELGFAPATHATFDFAKDAALYLQSSVPSFEYPRTDMPANIRWIGASVPEPPAGWTPPAWWPELKSRRVVLVTQGTINNDYDQLIRPAIRALAKENVLVVVTTGSKPAEEVAIDPLPKNVRVERFIPYAQLMPEVDVLLTNGGYGSVQIALAHAVPVVAFGKTEEKPEVANRLTYSGAGIGVKVLVPSESQIRFAVERVLGDRSYRRRAMEIGQELAGLNPANEAANHIEGLLGGWRLAASA